MQGADFAAVADGDAVAVELLDQVLGHRLAEVGAAVQEGDEGAAAGQPDRRLRGRVAAADDADPLAAAELPLGRAGGVEDADPLVVVEVVDRQAPVFGAGREQHRAGDDLVAFLEPDQVALLARLERLGAVGRRRAGAELARLGDRAAGQLAAADPGREAEVVLDPPRGAGLAAEHGALDHQRVEALGGAVDGGAEPGRAAAEDQQVDLLALAQLQPDPQRRARARRCSGCAARCRPGRRTSGISSGLSASSRAAASSLSSRGEPGVGEALAPGEVEQAPGLARVVRADDLDPDPLLALQQLAPLDEGGEQQVGERAVLEEQLAQHFALDRDVAQRLGDDGGEEDGLAGEQVHLAEEAGGAVADDLAAGGVEDRDLALEDRDEGIGRVADFEELLADLGGPLLAERGEGREL